MSSQETYRVGVRSQISQLPAHPMHQMSRAWQGRVPHSQLYGTGFVLHLHPHCLPPFLAHTLLPAPCRPQLCTDSSKHRLNLFREAWRRVAPDTLWQNGPQAEKVRVADMVTLRTHLQEQGRGRDRDEMWWGILRTYDISVHETIHGLDSARLQRGDAQGRCCQGKEVASVSLLPGGQVDLHMAMRHREAKPGPGSCGSLVCRGWLPQGGEWKAVRKSPKAAGSCQHVKLGLD